MISTTWAYMASSGFSDLDSSNAFTCFRYAVKVQTEAVAHSYDNYVFDI